VRNASNAALGFGAATIAVVILLVGYFFGVSPRLSAAADANAERQQQLDANEVLQATLDRRIKDAAEVPDLEVKTEEIAKYFPSTDDATPFRQDLLDGANATGVTIIKEEWATPALVENTLVFQPAADAFGLTSEVDGLAVDDLYANPITVTFAGTTPQVLAYLDYLQGDSHPYFLVSGFSADTVLSENSLLGRVFVAGDVTVSITGYTFTLGYTPPNPPLIVSHESQEPEYPNYRNLFLPIPTS